MPISTPADREFQVLRAGYIRDNVVLANFREGLRALVNPETGSLFTEEEIARATRPGTRWYNEAQALDDFGQLEQRNALYLADQVQLDRATGKWLTGFHGELWGETYLPGTPGSGLVRVQGTVGTIVLGSSTLPDDSAYQARDPAGNLYQVFGVYTVGSEGRVDVKMVALTPGASTNPIAGTVLTWVRRDPNMLATAVVQAGFAAGFTGGTDRETEAELASRIGSIIKYRPGPGNDAQFRLWGRESSNAVEDCFVFPCALNSGSVLIAITQKRAGTRGPFARIPNSETMATAIAYLTPPTSPVVAPGTFVVVTPAASLPSDVVLELALPRAAKQGWTDPQPFPSGPSIGQSAAYIVSVTNQQHFRINSGDATLPGQAALATVQGLQVPHLMVWDEALSQWCEVQVTQVTDAGGGMFDVVCSGAIPSMTLAVGQWVSPSTAYAPIVARTVEEYFDELGPGEVVDPLTDARGARCRRFPPVTEEHQPTATAVLATRVTEELAGIEANLASLSLASPSLPVSPQLGPNMLTLGKVAIYEL